MTQLGFIEIPDFYGGLNTRDGEGGVADNEYTQGDNVYLVQRGIAKRKGFSRWNGSARINTTATGYGIYDANFVSQSDKVVGVAGAKIAYKGTNIWTDITGSVTVSGTNPYLFTVINDNLVGVNGTDPAWYYAGTGTAATLSGDNIPTAPVTCETYASRLFLAQGRRLYWSEFMGNWNKFPTTSFQDFNSDIKGLRVIGDNQSSYIVILCTKGVHVCSFDPQSTQLGGQVTFTFDTISETNGCIAPATVQEVYVGSLGYAVMWADYDGIKIYNPSIGIALVSDKIRPDWEALAIDYSHLWTGTYYRPKGWYVLNCTGNGSTECDKQIVVDLLNSKPSNDQNSSGWVISGIFDWTASCFGVVKEDGVEKLIGCTTSGYWNYYDNTQNDNGTAITATFKTKAFDHNIPGLSKIFFSLGLQYLFLGGFDLDIETYFDHNTNKYSVTHTTVGEAVLDAFVLDQDVLASEAQSSEQLVITSVEIRGRGRMIQIQVSNSDVGQPFRIHRMQIRYKYGRTDLFK